MYYIYIFFLRFGSDITEILQQNIRTNVGNKPALLVPPFIQSQTPAALHRPQRRPCCLEMPKQDSFSNSVLLQGVDSLRGKAQVTDSRKIAKMKTKKTHPTIRKQRGGPDPQLMSIRRALSMSKAILIYSSWRFGRGSSVWGSQLPCKDVVSALLFLMKT